MTALAGLILVLTTASGGDAAGSSVPLAGSLDPSFGSGGVVSGNAASRTYVAGIYGIAVQPDGKIVVTGVQNDVGWLLARYLPDGAPDSSFGDGGYVETNLKGNDLAEANKIALQPDGKIVVAGRRVGGPCQDCSNVSSEFMLARYNPNGSLDTSFGTDGITTTVIPQPLPQLWDAYTSAVVVLPNGKILVAGAAESQGETTDKYGRPNLVDQESFALARYKPGGSLDPTFGDGGIAQTRFDGNLELSGIAVRPNGKIVATGTASRRGMALVQYRPDGSLDPTFGHDGKVAISARLKNGGGRPTLQDGKIVVAGWPRAARFLASGRLDTTFGKHGFATLPSARGPILVQRDGKILVAVYDNTGVARLLPNGRLDPSFGKHGIVRLWPVPGALAVTLALQGDGKILAGGSNYRRPFTWTLARLFGGNNCVVPLLRGQTVSKATATLKSSSCSRGRIAHRFSSTIARGRVIATKPARGARLRNGAKVALVVGRGKTAH
ncbi:MAG TPA: PASTA domain-containing protein [Gaiellaceae bacterium]|nr:PASTA domain-containing protein [Gaiellaceae bacterium]